MGGMTNLQIWNTSCMTAGSNCSKSCRKMTSCDSLASVKNSVKRDVVEDISMTYLWNLATRDTTISEG